MDLMDERILSLYKAAPPYMKCAIFAAIEYLLICQDLKLPANEDYVYSILALARRSNRRIKAVRDVLETF